MTSSFIESTLKRSDPQFETSLRPEKFHDFIGQENVKKRLHILVEAAKERGDALSHILLTGPPGLGKTTIASILAKAMGGRLVVLSGPTIEKAGDLAGVLTQLKKGDLLFIDELHRMTPTIEEYLYPAMEDFTLDLLIDSGANARSVRMKLNPFTLIGATTKAGLLSAPLRSRFPFVSRLDFYSSEDLAHIVQRSGACLGASIEKSVALEIANRSRGTPRIANNLLKWVRDFVQIHSGGAFLLPAVNEALQLLDIDQHGLDELDRRILKLIAEQFNGGPVGIATIAVAVGEEVGTLEEVYEPHLIQKGLLKRTPRGRELTIEGMKYLDN